MKKRYYIPGIISIVLLPILGIWYMNKHNYLQKLSAHSFTYVDFEEAKRFNEGLKEEEVDDIFFTNKSVKRIYEEVTLNHDKNDAKKFEYIDQFVNNVVQTRDTINGLQIHFGENATYNEFIEVLNIFDKRKAKLYTLNDKTMYFIDWNPVEDENVIPFDGTIWANDLINDPEKMFDFKKVFNDIKNQFQQNKIIYSAYGILFLVGIFYTFRNSKKPSK